MEVKLEKKMGAILSLYDYDSKTPPMSTMYARKKSFEGKRISDWLSSINVSIEKMAKAGFFYCDQKTVKCFDCGLKIGDWEKGENPFLLHCHLAKAQTGKDCCYALRKLAKARAKNQERIKKRGEKVKKKNGRDFLL